MMSSKSWPSLAMHICSRSLKLFSTLARISEGTPAISCRVRRQCLNTSALRYPHKKKSQGLNSHSASSKEITRQGNGGDPVETKTNLYRILTLYKVTFDQNYCDRLSFLTYVNMVKNTIRVYARLKRENTQKTISKYEISRRNDYEDIMLFPSHLTDGANNKTHRYRFCKVFDQTSNQEEVFDVIAKPIINSVIHGFNGTLFAYGQTGSGKTYAITGSPDEYNNRGVLPRSIQAIFEHTKVSSEKFSVCISYLEIYNEIGYDLLNPKYQPSNLEELPRVVLLEDGKGEAHLRNLSVLPVSNEQEAMRLLFLGDTNRTIAETPMNEYSSRSHCIFTIYITARSLNTGLIRRSKLHLVDLAGSERIHKSNISGMALNEAKHINLSLHYLEQVILALSQTNRSHIPYRNSMMTYILRDSLSGNSLTAMLATLAVTRKNLEETITTCKFAQRVAYISTEAVINEEIDPQQEIQFLRNEVDELRRQLIQVKGLNTNEKLNGEQKDYCRKIVRNYMKGSTELPAYLDERQIQLCFNIFKEYINNEGKIKKKNSEEVDMKTVETYNETIRQKDEEILNLRNLLEITPEKLKKTENNVIDSESKQNFNQNVYFSKLKSGLSPLEKEAFDVFLMDDNNQLDILTLQKTIYTKYKIANDVAATVQKCQSNIIDIRKKINSSTRNIEIMEKLKQYLISQQNLYRDSIQQLECLKKETDFLNERLKQAEVQLLYKFKQWINPEKLQPEHQRYDTKCDTDVFNCLKNCNEFLTDISSEQSSGYSSDSYSHDKKRHTDVTNDVTEFIKNHHKENRSNLTNFEENNIEKLISFQRIPNPIIENVCNYQPSYYKEPSQNNTLSQFLKHEVTDRFLHNMNGMKSAECIFPTKQETWGNNSSNTRCIFPENSQNSTSEKVCTRNISFLENNMHETANYNKNSGYKDSECIFPIKQETWGNNISNARCIFPENLQNSTSEKVCARKVSFLENNMHETANYNENSGYKDSNDFLEFMKTVPLTGDVEVDDEIFKFYRTKFKK